MELLLFKKRIDILYLLIPVRAIALNSEIPRVDSLCRPSLLMCESLLRVHPTVVQHSIFQKSS